MRRSCIEAGCRYAGGIRPIQAGRRVREGSRLHRGSEKEDSGNESKTFCKANLRKMQSH